MYQNKERPLKLNATSQNTAETVRYLNPSDIKVSEGFRVEVFAQRLDSPISMLFTDDGYMIIAESGLTSGNPRVLLLVDDHFEVIAERFNVPITGINYLNGVIYVSNRGFISVVNLDGTMQNIVAGLPSNGDYYNNRVVFGGNDKLYFGQGTATNSGVVGLDNSWVFTAPLSCDYPGNYITLNGQNFETYNMLIERAPEEIVSTGAFSPYGVPNLPLEVRKGVEKASGSILRANLDGTELELVAWGFRNPSYMKFDSMKRLFVSNNGYEVRGSRPIANALDEFFMVSPNLWHGWPDYSGGLPVNLPRFTPEGGTQPEFLLAKHPNYPPRPYTTFPVNSGIRGFDFDNNAAFGTYGDAYIAEFGPGRTITPYAGVGHQISKIDMNTGNVSTFASNNSGYSATRTGEGGFERPADVAFGPDGAMYVLDLGLDASDNPDDFVPNTGVIWRIIKT
ncbi:MAG: repeat containing protein [Herbinix sp.]|jgi:glucose/arabinose dehydrogenase|nr:repeat containing protein [Herbinix sp.]